MTAENLQAVIGIPQLKWSAGMPVLSWETGPPRLKWSLGTVTATA
jgi:hypothetical protein